MTRFTALPCPLSSPASHPLQEVAAYEGALARLEAADSPRPLEDRQFQVELQQAEDEAQQER